LFKSYLDVICLPSVNILLGYHLAFPGSHLKSDVIVVGISITAEFEAHITVFGIAFFIDDFN